MLDLAERDTKIIFETVYHVFKKLTHLDFFPGAWDIPFEKFNQGHKMIRPQV